MQFSTRFFILRDLIGAIFYCDRRLERVACGTILDVKLPPVKHNRNYQMSQPVGLAPNM